MDYKFNIFVVIREKTENRKKSIMAIAAFVSESAAKSFRKETIESNKFKEDEIWVELAHLVEFCYEDYEDIVWKNIEDLKSNDTVWVHWMYESKRPLCGYSNYAFADKKEAEKYFNEWYPDEEVSEFMKDHTLLECKVKR